MLHVAVIWLWKTNKQKKHFKKLDHVSDVFYSMALPTCAFAVLDQKAERVIKKNKNKKDYSRTTLTNFVAKFFVLSSHNCVCSSQPFLPIPSWVVLLGREEEAFANKVWALNLHVQ